MTVKLFGQVSGILDQAMGLDTGLGVNTNDATATAADIVSGLTAYVKGSKQTGTSTRKRWARGTTSAQSGPLTISGLGFAPSYIMGARGSTPGSYEAWLMVASKDGDFHFHTTPGTLNMIYGRNIPSGQGYVNVLTLVFGTDGFTVTIPSGYSAFDLRWYAFE